MDNTKEMLGKAITKMHNKIFPGSDNKRVFSSEPHSQLFTMLQVFDIPDDHTSERVKFIYEYLMEHGGNPRDQVISIQTQLGTSLTTPLLDRVWKHCKLKEQANVALARYENILRDVNALNSTGRE